MPDTDSTTTLGGVTMTTASVVIGQHYMLAPDSEMSDGSEVFFRNTEPIEVEVTETYGNSDVVVLPVDYPRHPSSQIVDPRFLSPMPPGSPPVRTLDDIKVGDVYRVTAATGGHGFDVGTEVKVATGQMLTRPYELSGGQASIYGTTSDVLHEPPWITGGTAWLVIRGHGVNAEFVRAVIAEHGSVPEWPLRECSVHTSPQHRPHYHVSYGGDVFDEEANGTRLGFNYTVYEEPGAHTQQGVRWASRAWLDANPQTEAVPEPEPSQICDDPPPEEVLRFLREERPDWSNRRQRHAIRDLLRNLSEARTAVDTARHERAEWLDRLIERSREVADEQDWCGVYDAGMEELGLPTRHDREQETQEVTVTARIEFSYTFDDNDFDEWFEGRFDESISSSPNSTTFTFTREFEETVTVNSGECACDEDIDWGETLPDWVADSGCSWDIDRTECSND